MITAETLMRFRKLMAQEARKEISDEDRKALEELKERMKFEEPDLYREEYNKYADAKGTCSDNKS